MSHSDFPKAKEARAPFIFDFGFVPLPPHPPVEFPPFPHDVPTADMKEFDCIAPVYVGELHACETPEAPGAPAIPIFAVNVLHSHTRVDGTPAVVVVAFPPFVPLFKTCPLACIVTVPVQNILYPAVCKIPVPVTVRDE